MVNKQAIVLQAIQIELRKTQEQRAIQESMAITFDIYLMDAMQVKHRIPMTMCRTLEVFSLKIKTHISNANNYQQFKRAIGGVYIPRSPRDAIHRRYLDADQFDLGIDNGNQVVQLRNDEDLQELVQPGTTVVLSIVLLRQRWTAEKYKCPICEKWNETMAIHSAGQWWADFIVCFPICIMNWHKKVTILVAGAICGLRKLLSVRHCQTQHPTSFLIVMSCAWFPTSMSSAMYVPELSKGIILKNAHFILQDVSF